MSLIDYKSLFASKLQFVLFLIALAGVYALLGYVFVLLATPPGLASPMYPPAGLGFAAGVIHPLGALSAVIGSLLSNIPSYGREFGWESWQKSCWISVGVGAQALLARVFVVQLLRHLQKASAQKMLGVLILCAPVVCLISASWATVGMVGFEWIDKHEAGAFWFAWWGGDFLGVILFAPITFSVVLALHKYRQAAVKIYTIIIGNILVCGLCVLALWQISNWDDQNQERDLFAFTQVLEFDRKRTEEMGFNRLEFYKFHLKNAKGYGQYVDLLKRNTLLFKLGISSFGLLEKAGDNDYINIIVHSAQNLSVGQEFVLEKQLENDSRLVQLVKQSATSERGVYYGVEEGVLRSMQWIQLDSERWIWLKTTVYEKVLEEMVTVNTKGFGVCVKNTNGQMVLWAGKCELPAESIQSTRMIQDNVQVTDWVVRSSSKSWGVFILSLVAVFSSIVVSVALILSAGKSIALERTMEQLSEARKEIERSERLAALGRLVSGISHEVLGPLGNARLLLGSIREDQKMLLEKISGTSVSKRQVQETLEKSQKKAALTEGAIEQVVELMDAFKGSAVGMHTSGLSVLMIQKWINDFELSTAPSLKEQCARLQIIVDPQVPKTIKTHVGILNQVLSNVVQNALLHGYDSVGLGNAAPLEDEKMQALRNNKVIALTIESQKQASVPGIMIQVRDWGVGLTVESEQRAFEPFFTTKAGRGGSGLGLAISYENLTRIGGAIQMKRAPNVGALVNIWVPDNS